MKTLGLVIVLCISVLVIMLLLVPIGVTVQVRSYPQEHLTTFGKLRVAEIDVKNSGWFTQTVQLPELTACVGDQEIPLDAWLASDSNVVRGSGQRKTIQLGAGQEGTVYLVASDITLYDTILVYKRQPYFSCLQPGTPIQ